MKLSALQALVAAIESGSLRSAARRLGLSQPALTKTIRELERELAAPLLERTSKGVLPTAQGKVLYDRALKANKELSTAVDEIRQLDGAMLGELNVGAVPVAVMLLLPETLRTFSRQFPDIRLRLSEELFFAQMQKLRSGQVDVAICGIPDGLASGEFHIETLIETEMVVVVRKGSPRQQARRLQELADAPWVYTGSTHDAGYAKLLFERHGMDGPPSRTIVNSTLALLSLVTAGDYVALMPRQIAVHPMAASFFAIVPLAEEGYRLQVAALIRRESAVAPVVRHFLAHLHRAAHHVNHRQDWDESSSLSC